MAYVLELRHLFGAVLTPSGKKAPSRELRSLERRDKVGKTRVDPSTAETKDDLEFAMQILAGLTILILASAGNAEWWVILVNRRHSFKYRHHQLLPFRVLHDLGIFIIPLFLLRFAGFGEHGLLRGGTFPQQSLALQGILGISLAGLVPLFYCVLRHLLRKPSRRLLSETSQIFNCLNPELNSEERDRVRGEATSMLVRLPGNQIFQLDVNQKRLQIEGSSAAERENTSPTPRLRIAHFSDLHFIGTPGPAFHRFVTDKLCELRPDFYVFTGDLLDRPELLERAKDMFARTMAVAPGYFVLGNHDWHLDPEHIRAELSTTGWVNVGETSRRISHGGHEILIAGTEAPWIGANPEVPAIESEQLRLLLSHSPDQRNFAAENSFNLMLCGHNHGGQVVLPTVGPVYSPSRYGVKYAGGVFEYGRLLMHVSRGLGSKDLLRWNCRPEITLLELEFSQRST